MTFSRHRTTSEAGHIAGVPRPEVGKDLLEHDIIHPPDMIRIEVCQDGG